MNDETKNDAAGLVAALQRAGHSVLALPDGGWLISHWTSSIHCPDTAALRRIATMVGATEQYAYRQQLESGGETPPPCNAQGPHE